MSNTGANRLTRKIYKQKKTEGGKHSK